MGGIEVFNSVSSLQSRLHSERENRTIGFVPTMGALHEGHMSLVKTSLNQCDITVVSIFVNPTQFNNSSDLEKYPRDFEKDVNILKKQGDIIVFAPIESEVYPENYKPVTLDLGEMGRVMEGKFRDGHFDGVINVVKRLFEIVQPKYAYFGEKDFQQLSVVQFMVKSFEMNIEIVRCPIYREPSGLASSSRNERLTDQQKEDALIIYDTLKKTRKDTDLYSPELTREAVKILFAHEDVPLELEYFDIVDPNTLQSLKTWEHGAHACIAAYCGEVRLIDNMQIIAPLLDFE